MHGKRENFKADKNVTAIVSLEQWFSTFLGSRHTNVLPKVWRHTSVKNKAKIMRKVLFLHAL